MIESPASIQTNSHILVQGFDYYEPSTLDEALSLCDQLKGRCRLAAGGTHLFIMMKMERDHPEAIINIKNLTELNGITIRHNQEVEIGSCCTIHDLCHDPLIQTRYPALSMACQAFGSAQIQIMGTIGGNLCNGSPASDTIPVLLIYNGRVRIAGPGGKRELPVQDFLLGPGKIALDTDEIVVSILLPPPPNHSTSAFVKISRVSADLAKASVAMLLQKQGNILTACRIAFGSVSPKVIRAVKAEEFLIGKTFTDEIALRAGSLAADSISPIDDVRSTAWYRKEIVRVMTHDVLEMLWRQEQAVDSGFPENRIRPEPTRVRLFASSAQKIEITLNVNGVDYPLLVSPNELLINVLREKLHLTGAKYGCGLGECSACSVLIDGQVHLSCLVLAIAARGRKIITIEGLQARDGSLDPLQEAFIDHGAYQCGYCTPGILMTVKSLLNEKPIPDEEDVRDYLKGNRCRCTGYISIVRAVMASIEDQKKR